VDADDGVGDGHDPTVAQIPPKGMTLPWGSAGAAAKMFHQANYLGKLSGMRTTDIAASEIAARLRLSATRLARRLRQVSGAGLSPSQQSALAVIANHGPLTLGALAEHERVAPPSITKVVSKLEADRLVTR